MMAQTIAIIGAGPGVGLAIAEKFGLQGYNVALLSRNTEKLAPLQSKLQARGITASIFKADILDRDSTTRALNQVIDAYGSIDVLEFSPSPAWETLRTPRNIDVENEQYHLDFQVLSAITAVQTVLPQMLERKTGSILFTTASAAQRPNFATASFGVAAGALLNYARLLHEDLGKDNVYVGIVSIGAIVVGEGIASKGDFPAGMLTIHVNEVAETHWNLHTKREVVEIIIGAN
ncbi:SDR family NAD(P)-dependent oxidoreductase [Larkinella rosea]|uniref:SDR family NAD(P)-dependent oxidoreductase n=1 Tax=Larkinella rosea TaxID=2025312 RepID=A0A3P1C2K2_9BACT|nr:SDR family NAD(P)-dependent oxidoreductase [Larkinella rosea]RRB07640.1 SDR family NAD(P)-dependent oxidoreductase [Larkinella rosea]